MSDQARGIAEGYIHGYSAEEQARLYEQARFLQPKVYESVDFSKQTRCLEVGCGVGAQTEILLRKFPQLRIHGVDASPAQIDAARKHLAKPVADGRVSLTVGDALHLEDPSGTYDGAFICWLLEHVREPVGILKEVRRALAPNGVIYCTEVMNSSFFLHPYSPATQTYWLAFNDQQWNLKGDPFVGAKLGNYLLEAGFKNIVTTVKDHHYDNRSPKLRAEFIEYWASLLLSGAPALMESGKVTAETVATMRQELKAVKDANDAVFFYAWVQARAEAP